MSHKMNDAVNNDSRTTVSKIWSLYFKNMEQNPSVMQQIFSTKINNLHTPFIHQILISNLTAKVTTTEILNLLQIENWYANSIIALFYE